MPVTAFAPAAPFPLTATSLRRNQSHARRPPPVRPVRMRADVVGEPDRADAPRGDVPGRKEAPIGGTVAPSDFEDVHTQSDATLADEDLDHASHPATDTKPSHVPNVSEAEMQAHVSDATDAKDTVGKSGAAESDTSIEAKTPVAKPAETKTSDSDKNSPAKASEKAGTSIKMSPEDIAKAKAAREAAAKVDEAKTAERRAKVEKVLKETQNALLKLGSATRVIKLGETARAKAETFVEGTISTGMEKEASQQDKLKGSAAQAAKAVVGAVTNIWGVSVAPKARDILPDGFQGLTDRALASTAVGLFFAIVLLPSLFSGGEKPKDAPEQKLDAETSTLERKLNRQRISSPSNVQSDAQKSVFPPEERVSPKSKIDVKKTEPAPPVPPVAPSAKTDSPPVVPVPSPTPAPPKQVPKAPEPIRPADVTPTMIMTTVGKALGPEANLVSAASFATLAAEPTIVLEVSKAYHKLPSIEQQRVAQILLASCRSLGYERVSLIEKGTGIEVAHAGVDIDLEDEAANLRAEVAALRESSDRLAIKAANDEAEIFKLQARLDEEREQFAANGAELEKRIKELRTENSGLLEDLNEARAEVSRVPDRIALEQRTIEAEQKSKKLIDTVEMLSIQVSKARSEEASAKQLSKESMDSAKEAYKEKEDALASVASQIEKAQKEAERKADELVAKIENEARSSVEASERKVELLEDKIATTEKQAAQTLDETTKAFEKQLRDEKSGREKEVQTIQSKYEAMLNDVQRRAKAELDTFAKEADKKMASAMKESKASLDSLMKERDQWRKDTEKVEVKAQKAAANAEREKNKLQDKIAKLEAKLKGKELPAEQSSGVPQEQAAASGASS